LTEAATLPTYIWEVPGSNLDQDKGYNNTTQGFVNLHSPSKKIDRSQLTQFVPSKLF